MFEKEHNFFEPFSHFKIKPWIRISVRFKTLDRDPDQHEMGADPKPWSSEPLTGTKFLPSLLWREGSGSL